MGKAGAGADKKKSVAGGAGGDARREITKTKEQLEEEKKIALSIRLKPLELDAMDSDDLKSKASEMFNIIIQLETDKYDYEQRRLTQELVMTERNCMKVAGRSSGQNLLMLSGKRSLRNSPRGHQRNFLSGSVRGQARRLVMLRPLRVRRKVVREHQQRMIMMKKRRKRKKKKRRRKKSKQCKYKEFKQV